MTATLSQDGVLTPQAAGTVVVAANRQGVTVKALLAIQPDPAPATTIPTSLDYERLLTKGEVLWMAHPTAADSAILLARLQLDYYEGHPPIITRADEQGVDLVVQKTETHRYLAPAIVPPFNVYAWQLPAYSKDKPVFIHRLDQARRRLLRPEEVPEPIATPTPIPSYSPPAPATGPLCTPPPMQWPNGYPCPTPTSP